MRVQAGHQWFSWSCVVTPILSFQNICPVFCRYSQVGKLSNNLIALYSVVGVLIHSYRFQSDGLVNLAWQYPREKWKDMSWKKSEDIEWLCFTSLQTWLDILCYQMMITEKCTWELHMRLPKWGELNMGVWVDRDHMDQFKHTFKSRKQWSDT